MAAGLTALQGSGLVLQLGDSSNTVPPADNPTDYLVSARDIRTVVEELWLAGAEAIAVNGERITATSAIIDIGGSILVNAAYLSPPYQVSAIGSPDLFDQVNSSAGFRDFVRRRVDAFGLQVGFAELKDVTIPAYAGTINLRFARPARAEPQSGPESVGRDAQPTQPAVDRRGDGDPRVSCSSSSSARSRSDRDSRRCRPRSSPSSWPTSTPGTTSCGWRSPPPRVSWPISRTPRPAASRRSTSSASISAGYGPGPGIDSVVGSGIRVTVAGPISGAGVEDLLNELRNAGSEALAVEDVRVVAGTVVAGDAGALSVENTALGDPFEIAALGNSATLTGSLTRAGGIVAQLAATYPDAQITVVPVDAVAIPATTRNLVPAHGAPKL